MTPEERRGWVARMGTRQAWWDAAREAALDPEVELVDAHLHLWPTRHFADPATGAAMPAGRFLPDEFLAGCGGHRVSEIVYVESGAGVLDDGPADLRPSGESAFAARMAADFTARGPAPRLAAVIGHADLRDPALASLIDAHQAASNGLLRGLRHSLARLDDPAARLLAGAAPAGLSADPAFRRGLALLGAQGLCFEAFQFHGQLDALTDLARAVPETLLVCNHLGCPIGSGMQPTDPVFDAWARSIDRLAECPNVVMKLGGLASRVTGYDGGMQALPPSSVEFVAARGRYFQHAIARFGAARCMFESNFPVDSTSISYGTLWNAYKRIAADHPPEARLDLLAGTARRVYRIGGSGAAA